MTEPHILAAAYRMLERFGSEAVREADIRATELRDRGETEATAFWQQVHDALLRLREDEPDQTKH